jgi:hypothetical protein
MMTVQGFDVLMVVGGGYELGALGALGAAISGHCLPRMPVGT